MRWFRSTSTGTMPRDMWVNREETDMDKYEQLIIEIIEFPNEDVVTDSNSNQDVQTSDVTFYNQT